MKRSILIGMIALISTSAIAQQQPFYDVTWGNGNGVRFWSDNSYKIHMGTGSEYFFGPVQDYSIKMNMSGGTPSRGWTWGVAGQTPVGALSTQGHFQVAGNLIANGGLYFTQSGIAPDGMPMARFNEAWGIRFNSHDSRWVFSSKPSVLIGYQPNGTDWGNDNLLVAGNVGIGTTTPAEDLHIVKDRASIIIQNTNVNNWSFLRLQGSGSNLWDIGQFGNNDFLEFRPNGNNEGRIVFKQSGNVGIGTTNPITELQVDINKLNNIYADALPGIFTRNNNATDNNYNGILFGDANGWGVAGVYAQVKSHTNHTGSMSFFTRKNGAAPAPQMTLDEDGQLGIGTTTPDSKLTVKGIIHTQEVKVDLNGSVAPDYVFEKDYPLISLEELKSYIDQNKHLPEIPSAKEMEADGINLKEMNLLLLKKVEELTLHVIELNKKNEQHEIEINLLKDQKRDQ